MTTPTRRASTSIFLDTARYRNRKEDNLFSPKRPPPRTSSAQLRLLLDPLCRPPMAPWRSLSRHHPVHSAGLHGDTRELVADLKPPSAALRSRPYGCGQRPRPASTSNAIGGDLHRHRRRRDRRRKSTKPTARVCSDAAGFPTAYSADRGGWMSTSLSRSRPSSTRRGESQRRRLRAALPSIDTSSSVPTPWRPSWSGPRFARRPPPAGTGSPRVIIAAVAQSRRAEPADYPACLRRARPFGRVRGDEVPTNSAATSFDSGRGRRADVGGHGSNACRRRRTPLLQLGLVPMAAIIADIGP